MGHQLQKAGTSIGANYREANHTECRADSLHKIGIAEKEAAETEYRLPPCDDARIGESGEPTWPPPEADELPAIFTSIGKTGRTRGS